MPPFASPDQLGFTGSLLTTLRESRAKLDAFIDDQMEQADAAAAAHEARVAQEQTFVDAQVSNLLQVELERGLYENGGNNEKAVGLAKRREELARQEDGVKHEIQSLQAKQTEQEKNLKALQQEEAKHRERADEANERKEKVEAAKRTTVDDLTRGIINYKFLGLDFEKAKDDRLKFTFTQLDAGDPNRTFSFFLNVNDEDAYEVEETMPPLHQSETIPLLENLNETDDLSAFVRGMRNAFSNTL
eukprot:CAMPEP_0202497394 /NCGR_PEP_ID=MMETSP1361-20130828/22663_1 /ASSEMBLY_ACC=CAM_ASM_000849 /TAXON_ID=210615 /ORGANISM="Staurosira complex sp., Strain CCMP2646" /LENGTH=244 /DNA_ID=CAMNT_0049128983 /DNA_START=27 /DNA_END=761 /DNA_ORIENTATION=+